MPEQLTVPERSELAECEATIERGRATFVDVGNALLRIRDRRLYRETHKTFEAYCKERWGKSRKDAYRQMDAAAVAGVLSPMGDIPNERIARELAPLKDDASAVRAVMHRASKNNGGAPTAAHVRREVLYEQLSPSSGMGAKRAIEIIDNDPQLARRVVNGELSLSTAYGELNRRKRQAGVRPPCGVEPPQNGRLMHDAIFEMLRNIESSVELLARYSTDGLSVPSRSTIKVRTGRVIEQIDAYRRRL